MTDVVDAATRSRMMAGIRGKNTRPELVVRKGLHSLGVRFRLHDRSLPGNPDIVLARYRGVIFVHGCFWHAHRCDAFRMPASRTTFWESKLTSNVGRDQRKIRDLRAAGWRVAVIWECATRRSLREGSVELFEIVHSWLAECDEPYIEISCDRRKGFRRRKSTARALSTRLFL